MLPIEVWIRIVRWLNYSDADALKQTCKYFESLVRDFSLLHEKLLHIELTQPEIFRRNMRIMYRDQEVGRWNNCWGTCPVVIPPRDIRECKVCPHFPGKMSKRIK